MTPTWTADEIAALRKFWTAGLSATQITAHIRGKSRSAILGKVHRMRLESRGPTSGLAPTANKSRMPRRNPDINCAARRAIIAAVHARKGSVHEAAAELGVSVNHVYSIATRCGVPFVAPGRPVGGVKGNMAALPVTDATVAYEAARRADGAMTFRTAPLSGRCKWPLHGESGMDMLVCCASIPICESYCEHHRIVAMAPSRRPYLEAAE